MSDTEHSVTSEELEKWNAEHDEPHPVFVVEHRPERQQIRSTDGETSRVSADANLCHECGFHEEPAQKNYRKCPECGAGFIGRREERMFAHTSEEQRSMNTDAAEEEDR